MILQQESEQFEQSYMTYLNEFFLACVQEKNSVLLIRCLRIYVTLDKIKDAENLVRKEIVSPLIDSVISIENLQIDLLGLKSIYNRLLNILSVELKQLLDITLHSNRCVFISVFHEVKFGMLLRAIVVSGFLRMVSIS